MSIQDLMAMSNRSQLAVIMKQSWSVYEGRTVCDFLSSTDTQPWLNEAIATGIALGVAGEVKHPGVIQLKSQANTTNSGYRHRMPTYFLSLSGGEKTTFAFKTGDVLTGVIRKMGFLDSINENEPTDGVYVKQNGNALRGYCANNSANSFTTTSYILQTNTWYRVVIILNSDATVATFTLYSDDSDNILWSAELNTNIPKGVGRETGHGDVITFAPSDQPITLLGSIDYMDIIIPARKTGLSSNELSSILTLENEVWEVE